MTREDAIYEIKQLAVLSNKKNIDRITEALEMAIEALADRKTESSSEKPNNSTISKMEQVEDEPQDEYPCEFCRNSNSQKCEECKDFGSNYEPQTDCPWK